LKNLGTMPDEITVTIPPVSATWKIKKRKKSKSRAERAKEKEKLRKLLANTENKPDIDYLLRRKIERY